MLLVKDVLIVPPYFANKSNSKRDYNHAFNLLRWSVFVLSYHTDSTGLNIVDFKIHSQTEDDLFYYVSIGTYDTYLTLNSKIKVYCSCPDFAYTFAYVLYKHNALLYPEEFPIEFKTIPPKKRNPYQIPFVCKHLYTVIKYCVEHKFKFTLDEVEKYNKRNRIIRPIFEVTFRFYKYIEELQKRVKRHYRQRSRT